MRYLIKIKLLLFIIIAVSCNWPEPVTSPVSPETPKALRNNNVLEEVESFSKGRDDLVDELYKEVVAKNPDLKVIETLISNNKETQTEALAAFENYNNKNNQYYNVATDHIQGISDSVLRSKLMYMIKESQQKYYGKSAKISALIEQTGIQSITISDYRDALKIIVTLPIIERFQDDNLPYDSLYRRINRDQQDLIVKLKKKVSL